MKKLIMALVMLAPMSAMAGAYVQANVGTSSIFLEGADETYEQNGEVSYGVSFGGTTGKNGRVAIDYTQFADIKDKGTIEDGIFSTVNAEVNLKAKSVGISYIYDFKNNSPVTPYLGTRFGVTQIEMNGEVVDEGILSTTTYTVQEKETHASVGLITGVQYQITPKVALDLAAEYNYLGRLESLDESDIHQFGVKAGMRADF